MSDYDNYETERYNGWTNYATWRVNLEIADDYCARFDAAEYGAFNTASDLADAIREYAEELIDDGSDTAGNGLAKSYAMSFLDQVNWTEIAEHNTELIASDDNA